MADDNIPTNLKELIPFINTVLLIHTNKKLIEIEEKVSKKKSSPAPLQKKKRSHNGKR